MGVVHFEHLSVCWCYQPQKPYFFDLLGGTHILLLKKQEKLKKTKQYLKKCLKFLWKYNADS